MRTAAIRTTTAMAMFLNMDASGALLELRSGRRALDHQPDDVHDESDGGQEADAEEVGPPGLPVRQITDRVQETRGGEDSEDDPAGPGTPAPEHEDKAQEKDGVN